LEECERERYRRDKSIIKNLRKRSTKELAAKEISTNPE